MARQKPKILLDYTDPTTFKADQILEAAGIYAIFYDGKPINIRNISKVTDDGVRYKKTAFSNPSHAKNQCAKLNAQFKTDKFQVFELKSGDAYTD
jgi:hypothetical protein